MTGTSKLIELPETTSALRNVLVRVITEPTAPWQLIARAAELVALDARFDDWFLRHAKASLSAATLEELLELSDTVTADVEEAWQARAAADWAGVERAVQAAAAALADAMARGTDGTSKPREP
jgi:hypothetical protein